MGSLNNFLMKSVIGNRWLLTDYRSPITDYFFLRRSNNFLPPSAAPAAISKLIPPSIGILQGGGQQRGGPPGGPTGGPIPTAKHSSEQKNKIIANAKSAGMIFLNICFSVCENKDKKNTR